MKVLVTLFVTLVLLSCSRRPVYFGSFSQQEEKKVKGEKKFVAHKERLTADLELSFQYPERYKIKRIDSTLFIHKESAATLQSIRMHGIWSIHMTHSPENPVEAWINNVRSGNAQIISETRDSTLLNGQKALRVNFLDADHRIVCQRVYVHDFPYWFEIRNNGPVDKEFNIFYHSIKLIKL